MKLDGRVDMSEANVVLRPQVNEILFIRELLLKIVGLNTPSATRPTECRKKGKI